MNTATKKWLYGLAAGFIGGGAGAASSGIATQIVEPGIYGWHKIEIMALAFIITGATHAFAYLSQSPLPAWDMATERRTPAEMTVEKVSPTEAVVTLTPQGTVETSKEKETVASPAVTEVKP